MTQASTFSPVEVNCASRPEKDMALAQAIAPLFEHLVGDGRSFIDPTCTIWASEPAKDIVERLSSKPHTNGTSMNQWDMLDLQLQGASTATLLLVAELVFLREHALSNAAPQTRKKHVTGVLKHCDDVFDLPEQMLEWLGRPTKHGGLKAGAGFNLRLSVHLTWMARFVIAFRQLPEEERRELVDDPPRLQTFFLGTGDDCADIRSILQFLLVPEYFEPISSAPMKKQIRNGFIDLIDTDGGDSPDVLDRDLYNIRTAVAQDRHGTFHYWDDELRPMWSEDHNDEAINESSTPQYWVYAPGPKACFWDEFYELGMMALGWDHLGDFSMYPSQEAVCEALQDEASDKRPTNAARAVWEFHRVMKIGDVVFAKRGRSQILGRGVITSEPYFDESRTEYRYVRSVQWEARGEWEAPIALVNKTLTNITQKRRAIEAVEDLFAAEDVDIVVPIRHVKGYTEEDFLSDVFFTSEQLARLQSLMSRKKNVILTGPPGVGKTFVAKRAAFVRMGEKDSARIEQIQFHQSYSYEDFMMGFRPNKDGGFDLVDGSFYTFCEKAREEPNRDFFFIIDEINRGNVSKIFGELLMLVEADKRGHTLRLVYNDELFSVPTNVFIIGTMNSADRSLAVMDYALRRRFGFFAISPAFETEGFQAWMEEVKSPAFDRLVALIQQLNSEIEEDPRLGRGFMIGHSYLSKSAAQDGDEEWLYSVVEDDLIPLIEEYWFDDPGLVETWAQRLRSVVE
ncbi:AAA domain-containing protein [Corynebacterium sp. zg254]|uniref:AAA domain-containing protein n=1 Tax=Corynebacterium zhongnanshanii TaxID=2768834 RepID=A0ABQ6VFU0_9CORY|nr:MULTISPECIES: AAA family ATPase [Corynebacterium]KAB3523287.1 AAA domain-containing protein [Corynebacterium zhongnanshanii]MCR5913592.1 AAA domain-containing protein [Corynebacterium sp. zg254]